MTNDEKTQPINNGQRVYKVDVLEKEIARLEERDKKRETEVDELKLQVARLSERMTYFQAAQGAFTLIMSSIAAVFGGSR